MHAVAVQRVCFIGFALLAGSSPVLQAAVPQNLAPQARVRANSEYNDRYLAKFAVDGKVPPAGSQSQDMGAAWCVRKAHSGDQGEFSLQWPAPVDAAELVYFGRTSWYMNECWKDFEVYLDDAPEPAAKASFKMIHGPQRVKLPPGKVRKITLRFLNSHGGMNPGAAEIMVLDTSPSPKEFAAFLAKAAPEAALLSTGAADSVAPPALGCLIRKLQGIHGRRYAQADAHRALFDQLAAEEALSPEQEAKLIALQREVLLFDVDRLLVIKRHEITASHVYTYHYEGQRNGGGLYLVDPHHPNAEPVELVASPDGQILDCELSYDGRQVLFSWRTESGGGYHLWTVDIDGGRLTQLTDGEWHDYNGCWLPDGGIAFLSTRSPQFAYCWHAPVGVVHRMNADGTGVRRLSANYLNDFTPAVLDDGRLIYSRWEYVDRPAIPIQSLWTINPDGSGLSAYFGNRVLTPGTFMEARSLPGTARILCTMTGHNGPTRGAIGVVDRSLGINAQAAITNITPDTPLGPVDKGNGNTGGSKPYSGPMPLDGLRFLVSARGPVRVRTVAGDCVSTALPAPGDGMQYFHAQPVRARFKPPVIPPTIPRQPEAGENMAVLYLQDVYNGLQPWVRRGEIRSIRVVRELHKPLRIDPGKRAFGFQFPVISCGATYAGKQVLGEVDLEPDGSACFRVPAGLPIYFMAIDHQGRAVQRMRSFTHLMPGEVQGCIGCHEHRRSGARPQLGDAYALNPKDLRPPEWGTEGFDYTRIVQPVFDRHCVKCHQPLDPPQGIDLTGDKTDFFNVSYDVLARENQGRRGTRYVNWIPTYNGQEWNILEVQPKTWGSPASRLAEIVLGDHLNQDGQPRFVLSQGERRRVLAWIDLNVPYYGTSETAYPERKGCRQIVPERLEEVLADVARRRCAECHQGGNIPRRQWMRITRPELNPFLVAPLAQTGQASVSAGAGQVSVPAGGSHRCSRPVFATRDDPDYQAILATFEPVQKMLEARPRMDMPGAEASCEVSRRCQ